LDRLIRDYVRCWHLADICVARLTASAAAALKINLKVLTSAGAFFGVVSGRCQLPLSESVPYFDSKSVGAGRRINHHRAARTQASGG
jgi:hypothetical protein